MGVFQKQGVWWIDYYVTGKRKREKIGPNKRLAQTVLEKRKVQIAENKYLDKRKERKVRFSEFAGEYYEYSRVNKKSWGRDRTSLNHLTTFFGDKNLNEITPDLIERYKAQRKNSISARGTGVSPASINRELACLKNMFTKAIEWGKVIDNPAIKVKLFKEPNGRLRYLETPEIKRLLVSCSPHLKPIVVVALNTGMRKGEILKLKWDHLDFSNELVFVEDTKNGHRREIPMNRLLTETLKSAKSRFRESGEYVFCHEDGKPYLNVRKSFETALRRAGIEDFRFHDLRHTFASRLVMAGVDLATVKELLGHKSLEMTLRYSHLSPEHKRQAVAVFDSEMDTYTVTSQFPQFVSVRNSLNSLGAPVAQADRARDS